MQQLRRNRWSRGVSYLLVAMMCVPQGLWLWPAQAQEAGQKVPAVVVLPFQDKTGRVGGALMREATAAAALALEDSKQFVVISTSDLERELGALHLTPPLSTPQQQRLGERLQADKVLVGTLTDLAVDARTGRARAALQLMMLDVKVGEYLDGAATAIETRAIPGFSGDVASVTHEALRQVAEAAVNQMISSTVRRGTVELVDDQGNVNINLGTNDGLEMGSELLVMRPVWQPDIEQVTMRRVGVIRITDIRADMAVARTVEGARPSTGDRLYRIYRPVPVQLAVARQKAIRSGMQLVAAGLLLLGLVATATTGTTSSGSQLTGYLAQAAPGADPVIRLEARTSNTAISKTHGWLVFRAANNPNFLSLPDFLVGAVSGQAQRHWVCDDDPFDTNIVEDYEISFQYFDQGDLEDGSVTVSYNDLPLNRGTRYYYRVRRIVEPLPRPGENPPIGTTQQQNLANPEIDTDPDDRVLSEPSNTCGPITLFTPPILVSPPDGDQNQRADRVTFSWQPSVGANEYVVQIFPASDPDGLQAPVLQSALVRAQAGASVLSVTIEGFDRLGGNKFYWRVGARQSNDPVQPLDLRTGRRGWLYSAMRSFTIAIMPPPTPSNAKATNSGAASPMPSTGSLPNIWRGRVWRQR